MKNILNTKLLLVDKGEILYVFKKDNLIPEEFSIDKNIKNNFEFIVSSKNEDIDVYLQFLKQQRYDKLINLKKQLQLDDISNDINKIRDVNTILTKNGNLNIIDANNIIFNSFELTFDNDFSIVKNNLNYNPYVQNPNTALGLFENATLFKPFLEESLGVKLQYFSFNKCDNQLYINFVDDSNQQYFIKDNLLHAFVKENSVSLEDFYKNKYDSDYREDSINTFKNYYEVSRQIKRALNSLDEFNNIENQKNYISSRDSSLIFNASLTSIACINNPSIAPALVLLPLAEETAISLTSNFISNKLNLDPDEALFMSKVSFTLVKSGLKNLNIDILDMVLDKTNMDDKFNTLIDSTDLDNNVKDALKHLYKETRSTDFNNLNIFGLNQITEETNKEFNLSTYTRNTLKDTIEELNSNNIKDLVSHHRTYIKEEYESKDINKEDSGIEV